MASWRCTSLVVRYSPGRSAPPSPIPMTAKQRISPYNFLVPRGVALRWAEREIKLSMVKGALMERLSSFSVVPLTCVLATPLRMERIR